MNRLRPLSIVLMVIGFGTLGVHAARVYMINNGLQELNARRSEAMSAANGDREAKEASRDMKTMSDKLRTRGISTTHYNEAMEQSPLYYGGGVLFVAAGGVMLLVCRRKSSAASLPESE